MVFILSALWWIRIRGLWKLSDGRDWLEGNLGLVLMGGAILQFSSVQFSSVTQSCLTLWPHESQYARPPCPSPTPGVYSNSCASSRWCHPAISSSVIPFSSSCPQSLPASEYFPMSQLFTWGGRSIGVSTLASVLPKNTQDWSPSEWTGCILLNKTIFRGNIQHYA